MKVIRTVERNLDRNGLVQLCSSMLQTILSNADFFSSLGCGTKEEWKLLFLG